MMNSEQLQRYMDDDKAGWIVPFWGWVMHLCPSAPQLLLYLTIVATGIQIALGLQKAVYRRRQEKRRKDLVSQIRFDRTDSGPHSHGAR